MRTSIGGQSGAGTPGTTYTTLVSSGDIVGAKPFPGPKHDVMVDVELSDPAAVKMAQYVQVRLSARGRVMYSYVLDNGVLTTVSISVSVPPTQAASSPPLTEVALPVQPPVTSLDSTFPSPLFGRELPPQNAIIAILTSGPLPVPARIVSARNAPALSQEVNKVLTVPEPYSVFPTMEIDVHVMPPAGQAMTPALLDQAKQVLVKRATALGLTVAQATTADTDQIRLQLQWVALPPSFIKQTLTTTGLFEIIDPQGKYLAPGTVVQTTLNGSGSAATPAAATPGAATPGAVYTTVVSNADIKDAFPTADQTGEQVVGFTLNDAGAARMYQFTRGHLGQPLAIVLDKRVLSTVTIQAAIADAGIIAPVGPPVMGITATGATPTAGPPALAQNELVAILKSGALPATVVIDSVMAAPPVTAQSATPAAYATAQAGGGWQGFTPNDGVEITIQVDADGVISGDAAAVAQALAQLQTQLKAFKSPCRVGLVLTYGAGDIGPGNQLASALNNLMKNNFPNLIDPVMTVFRHFSDNGLDAGTVKIDLYLYEGCPVNGATPAPGS